MCFIYHKKQKLIKKAKLNIFSYTPVGSPKMIGTSALGPNPSRDVRKRTASSGTMGGWSAHMLSSSMQGTSRLRWDRGGAKTDVERGQILGGGGGARCM